MRQSHYHNVSDPQLLACNFCQHQQKHLRTRKISSQFLFRLSSGFLCNSQRPITWLVKLWGRIVKLLLRNWHRDIHTNLTIFFLEHKFCTSPFLSIALNNNWDVPRIKHKFCNLKMWIEICAKGTHPSSQY